MTSTIVLVEDSDDLRDTYTDYFERHDYIVLASQNGEEALKILDELELIIYDEKQPVIVLLDVILPGINGFEVCKIIREKFQENVYIMMISGVRTESEDRVDGLDFGADIFRPKSHIKSLSEILAQVKRYEKSLKSDHLVWDFEDTHLRFSIKNRKVEFNGNEIHLTRFQFNLLKYLYKNKDRPCTRDEIYNKVWENKYGVYDDGAINTCVSRIRKKIDPPPKNEPSYIRTVSRVGYQFVSKKG